MSAIAFQPPARTLASSCFAWSSSFINVAWPARSKLISPTAQVAIVLFAAQITSFGGPALVLRFILLSKTELAVTTITLRPCGWRY